MRDNVGGNGARPGVVGIDWSEKRKHYDGLLDVLALGRRSETTSDCWSTLDVLTLLRPCQSSLKALGCVSRASAFCDFELDGALLELRLRKPMGQFPLAADAFQRIMLVGAM